MKKICVLAIVLMGFGFVGCSDDDSGGGNSGDSLCGPRRSDSDLGTEACQCSPAKKGVREEPILEHCKNFIPEHTKATGCSRSYVCEYECEEGYFDDGIACVERGSIIYEPGRVKVGSGRYVDVKLSYKDTSRSDETVLLVNSLDESCVKPDRVHLPMSGAGSVLRINGEGKNCKADVVVTNPQKAEDSFTMHVECSGSEGTTIKDTDKKKTLDCYTDADCQEGVCDSRQGYMCAKECLPGDNMDEGSVCREDRRPAGTSFDTVWETKDADEEIVLSFSSDASDCKLQIAWDDETTEEVSCAGPTAKHSYASAGQHTVRVTGDISNWKAADTSATEDVNAAKLVDVKSFGPVVLGHGAFKGCVNLEGYTAEDIPNMNKLTDMGEMFSGCILLNEEKIGNWDTRNVTDMSYAFSGAAAFNKYIAAWNTSKVTNMSHMFEGAAKFNQYLVIWDTSKVTDMSHMFDGATGFNSNIKSWKTSNVTNMNSMFKDAKAFNRNISGWKTSKVTDMSHMFEGAEAFNQNLAKWDMSSVTTVEDIFKGSDISETAFCSTSQNESWSKWKDALGVSEYTCK